MPIRKPTRRDLLIVIGRLQRMIGKAMANNHDRNPERVPETMCALQEAHDLCIDARGYDPPIEGRSPWASPKVESRDTPTEPSHE